MKYNPNEIKIGLTLIARRSEKYQDTALEALAYIRHLEGELRRQGFNEYTDKEEEQ